MLSIGIISRSKNIEFVKELNENNFIQAFNIKNQNDLKKSGPIDILVLEDLIIKKEVIEEIIQKVKYLIIQDNITNIEFNLDKEINIITFGFNHKSTVTVSSATVDSIVICIQRVIKGIHQKFIQPKECIIKNTNKYNINKYIIKKIIEEILEN